MRHQCPKHRLKLPRPHEEVFCDMVAPKTNEFEEKKFLFATKSKPSPKSFYFFRYRHLKFELFSTTATKKSVLENLIITKRLIRCEIFWILSLFMISLQIYLMTNRRMQLVKCYKILALTMIFQMEGAGDRVPCHGVSWQMCTQFTVFCKQVSIINPKIIVFCRNDLSNKVKNKICSMLILELYAFEIWFFFFFFFQKKDKNKKWNKQTKKSTAVVDPWHLKVQVAE